MSEAKPVPVQLDPALSDQVDAIAAAMDRPKAWVIEQAVGDFVSARTWQLAAIDEGIKAADEGRVVAHQDVAAWIRSWGQPDELPPPRCG